MKFSDSKPYFWSFGTIASCTVFMVSRQSLAGWMHPYPYIFKWWVDDDASPEAKWKPTSFSALSLDRPGTTLCWELHSPSTFHQELHIAAYYFLVCSWCAGLSSMENIWWVTPGHDVLYKWGQDVFVLWLAAMLTKEMKLIKHNALHWKHNAKHFITNTNLCIVNIMQCTTHTNLCIANTRQCIANAMSCQCHALQMQCHALQTLCNASQMQCNDLL